MCLIYCPFVNEFQKDTNLRQLYMYYNICFALMLSQGEKESKILQKNFKLRCTVFKMS